MLLLKRFSHELSGSASRRHRHNNPSADIGAPRKKVSLRSQSTTSATKNMNKNPRNFFAGQFPTTMFTPNSPKISRKRCSETCCIDKKQASHSSTSYHQGNANSRKLTQRSCEIIESQARNKSIFCQHFQSEPCLFLREESIFLHELQNLFHHFTQGSLWFHLRWMNHYRRTSLHCFIPMQ